MSWAINAARSKRNDVTPGTSAFIKNEMIALTSESLENTNKIFDTVSQHVEHLNLLKANLYPPSSPKSNEDDADTIWHHLLDLDKLELQHISFSDDNRNGSGVNTQLYSQRESEFHSSYPHNNHSREHSVHSHNKHSQKPGLHLTDLEPQNDSRSQERNQLHHSQPHTSTSPPPIHPGLFEPVVAHQSANQETNDHNIPALKMTPSHKKGTSNFVKATQTASKLPSAHISSPYTHNDHTSDSSLYPIPPKTLPLSSSSPVKDEHDLKRHQTPYSKVPLPTTSPQADLSFIPIASTINPNKAVVKKSPPKSTTTVALSSVNIDSTNIENKEELSRQSRTGNQTNGHGKAASNVYDYRRNNILSSDHKSSFDLIGDEDDSFQAIRYAIRKSFASSSIPKPLYPSSFDSKDAPDSNDKAPPRSSDNTRYPIQNSNHPSSNNNNGGSHDTTSDAKKSGTIASSRGSAINPLAAGSQAQSIAGRPRDDNLQHTKRSSIAHKTPKRSSVYVPLPSREPLSGLSNSLAASTKSNKVNKTRFIEKLEASQNENVKILAENRNNSHSNQNSTSRKSSTHPSVLDSNYIRYSMKGRQSMRHLNLDSSEKEDKNVPNQKELMVNSRPSSQDNGTKDLGSKRSPEHRKTEHIRSGVFSLGSRDMSARRATSAVQTTELEPKRETIPVHLKTFDTLTTLRKNLFNFNDVTNTTAIPPLSSNDFLRRSRNVFINTENNFESSKLFASSSVPDVSDPREHAHPELIIKNDTPSDASIFKQSRQPLAAVVEHNNTSLNPRPPSPARAKTPSFAASTPGTTSPIRSTSGLRRKSPTRLASSNANTKSSFESKTSISKLHTKDRDGSRPTSPQKVASPTRVIPATKLGSPNRTVSPARARSPTRKASTASTLKTESASPTRYGSRSVLSMDQLRASPTDHGSVLATNESKKLSSKKEMDMVSRLLAPTTSSAAKSVKSPTTDRTITTHTREKPTAIPTKEGHELMQSSTESKNRLSDQVADSAGPNSPPSLGRKHTLPSDDDGNSDRPTKSRPPHKKSLMAERNEAASQRTKQKIVISSSHRHDNKLFNLAPLRLQSPSTVRLAEQKRGNRGPSKTASTAPVPHSSNSAIPNQQYDKTSSSISHQQWKPNLDRSAKLTLTEVNLKPTQKPNDMLVSAESHSSKRRNAVPLPDAARGKRSIKNKNFASTGSGRSKGNTTEAWAETHKKAAHTTSSINREPSVSFGTSTTPSATGHVLNTPTSKHFTADNLPEIPSDDEGDQRSRYIQKWAATPELQRIMEDNKNIDPVSIFGEVPPLNIDEIFESSASRFRGRASP